jgi:hypothetical protein
MWSVWLALAEPLIQAFAAAFGQWRHDQAVADAATAAQALAASKAAREAERAMSAAAKPMTDAELLVALDGGRL